jgi:peptidoglycan/xylan/chitin deacetylase (PgdA/CDA1 family)
MSKRFVIGGAVVLAFLVAGAVFVFVSWGTVRRVESTAPIASIGPTVTPANSFVPSASDTAAELQQRSAPVASTSTVHVPLIRSWRMVNEPIVKPGELSVRVPVLMYHHVRELTPNLSLTAQLLTVSPQSFATQMQELLDLGYHPITPRQLFLALTTNAELPPKSVIVTFDDGYRDVYQNAWPTLTRLKIPATFFIISHTLASPAYIDKAMLREMDATGLANIASHTQTHVNVPTLSAASQLEEVKGSKADLENVLGHPVLDFAYPYGGVNSSTAALVSSTGYEMAFSTFLGSLHTPSDLFELRRIRVGDGESLKPILERFSK